MADPGTAPVDLPRLGEALAYYKLHRGEIAIGSRHWHLLLGCTDTRPKHWVGKLKSWRLKRLTWAGERPAGKVWAESCHAKPVRNASHWLNVKNYIADHEAQGAAVGSKLVADE